MEFSYESIEIGTLVEMLNFGLVCDGDSQKIKVVSYE